MTCVTLVMVSSSCSTSGRGRITLVMESSSCSTFDRGRVSLVMVSNSCFTRTSVTSRAGTVTITRVTRPQPLVEQELLLTITRVTRPLPLVEQELLTITRITVVFLLWKVFPAVLVTEAVLLQ
jgi:hypothetical protein